MLQTIRVVPVYELLLTQKPPAFSSKIDFSYVSYVCLSAQIKDTRLLTAVWVRVESVLDDQCWWRASRDSLLPGPLPGVFLGGETSKLSNLALAENLVGSYWWFQGSLFKGFRRQAPYYPGTLKPEPRHEISHSRY